MNVAAHGMGMWAGPDQSGPWASPFHGMGMWAGPGQSGPWASPFHGMGAAQDWAQAVAKTARSAIRSATFRSQVSPEVTVDPNQRAPRTAAQGGLSEAALRFAKPQWILDTAFGQVYLAPWGVPERNYFPLIMVGAILGTAVIGGLVVRGLRR